MVTTKEKPRPVNQTCIKWRPLIFPDVKRVLGREKRQRPKEAGASHLFTNSPGSGNPADRHAPERTGVSRTKKTPLAASTANSDIFTVDNNEENLDYTLIDRDDSDSADESRDSGSLDESICQENKVDGPANVYEEFMGADPSTPKKELVISNDLSQRIQIWIKQGLNKDDKTTKLKLLEKIPRTGQLNLEPPALDQDILIPKLLKNDNFLRNYANLASGALAASAIVFDALSTADFEGVDGSIIRGNLANSIQLLSQLLYELNISRRHKIIDACNDPIIQKLLKKTESTDFLFDGKLKSLQETGKTVGKSQKDFGFGGKRSFAAGKTSTPSPNHLNWESSSQRREPGRSSNFRKQASTSRYNSENRFKPYPPRKSHHQTRPHQDRRR